MRMFLAGIIIAIIAASAVSAVVSSQFSLAPQGLKGDTGATGPAGPQGATGETGPAGAAGNVGPKGEEGTKGDTGSPGAKGDTGPQGQQGPPGPQGPYLPDYDSGWINISDKAGQYFNVTHNLNSANVLVDITGKATANGGIHQQFLGLGTSPGWQKTYGGDDEEYANSVARTADGGYILVGVEYSFESNDYDALLVKINPKGNMEWNKTYGGSGDEFGTSVAQISDGGYIVAASSDSFGNGSQDMFLFRTDHGGELLWNLTYGGSKYDSGTFVVTANDGGFLVGGDTQSLSSGNIDAWLVKTYSNGTMQWNITCGGAGYDKVSSAIQTADDGFAITGYTDSYGIDLDDAWLIRIDASGTCQWNKTIGGTGNDAGFSILQASDGGFIVAGATNSSATGDYDMYLYKTDVQGELIWYRIFGGAGYEEADSVAADKNGGYVLAGFTSSYGAGNYDAYVVKTDGAGNMLSDKTYGGEGYDEAWAITAGSEGGFIIAGFTNSYGGGGADAWVINTGSDGNVGLSRMDTTSDAVNLYRGESDPYWNYLRVQIWVIR